MTPWVKTLQVLAHPEPRASHRPLAQNDLGFLAEWARGCASKPFWDPIWVGEFTTQFRTYLGGDWDLHWGYDLDFDPWPSVDPSSSALQPSKKTKKNTLVELVHCRFAGWLPPDRDPRMWTRLAAGNHWGTV